MTDHTPELWEITYDSVNDRFTITDQKSGHLLAVFKNKHNVNLIAAALEMLDMLIELRELIYEDKGGVIDLIKEIDDLIDKATGHSNDY